MWGSGTERPFLMQLGHVSPLDDDRLEKLFQWLDVIPLSRPKKNVSRDFSDGVLVAEVIKYFLPKSVQMHNFTESQATKQKEHNWFHLNRKVLPLISLELAPQVIRAISVCEKWVAENFLLFLREFIDLHLAGEHGRRYKQQLIEQQRLKVKDPFRFRIQQEKLQQQHQQEQLPPPPDHYLDWESPTPEDNRGMDSGELDLRLSPRKADMGVSNSAEDFYTPSSLKVTPKFSGAQFISPRSQMKAPKKAAEMVPRALLDERDKILAARQETIEVSSLLQIQVQMLQAKIQKMEHMLSLKDIRIEDLSARVEHLEKQFNGYDVLTPKAAPSGKPPWLVSKTGKSRHAMAPQNSQNTLPLVSKRRDYTAPSGDNGMGSVSFTGGRKTVGLYSS